MIEPKPKEPTKHQYDYGMSFLLANSIVIEISSSDAQTVISFLRTYGLENDYKVHA